MRKYDEENSACLLSHPVRGAWIEMDIDIITIKDTGVSHPVRGAWIEIFIHLLSCDDLSPSHPVRGAWIEIRIYICSVVLYGSHPVRGAWIEILQIILRRKRCKVAPRQGCVD